MSSDLARLVSAPRIDPRRLQALKDTPAVPHPGLSETLMRFLLHRLYGGQLAKLTAIVRCFRQIPLQRLGTHHYTPHHQRICPIAGLTTRDGSFRRAPHTTG